MTRDYGKGVFGRNQLDFLDKVELHRESAAGVLRLLLTQGHRCPLRSVVSSLASFDQVILACCEDRPDIPLLSSQLEYDGTDFHAFELTISTLGRVHIRSCAEGRPSCDPSIQLISVGFIQLPSSLYHHALKLEAIKRDYENSCYERLQTTLANAVSRGELPAIVQSVIEQVEHVESVCFYVGDTLLRVVEGSSNLTTSKEGLGYLDALRSRPFSDWTREHILVVSSLYSLFLSGRSVRFEEFNGLTLTAVSVLDRLRTLFEQYHSHDVTPRVPFDADLFSVAREIRSMSGAAVGRSWLRYRWIFGLTFYKTERVLDCLTSTEDVDVFRSEFGGLYSVLLGRPLPPHSDELRAVGDMARAALYKSINGSAVHASYQPAQTWVEALIQVIVGSAVKATQADYGMSSSLRNLKRLVVPERGALLDAVLQLKRADFYTCFVSNDLSRRYGPAIADEVAASCQRRMMFNRWHFIPGNFEHEAIPSTRHWYYPPLVPDIAVHSDVRRQGHARAYVRYSIRVPGPDMSLPPLSLNGVDFRGFFDVRVVRMEGRTFEVEDMLRARRRNVWMGIVFQVLVKYLESTPEDTEFSIYGFAPGVYQDLQPDTARGRVIAAPLEASL